MLRKIPICNLETLEYFVLACLNLRTFIRWMITISIQEYLFRFASSRPKMNVLWFRVDSCYKRLLQWTFYKILVFLCKMSPLKKDWHFRFANSLQGSYCPSKISIWIEKLMIEEYICSIKLFFYKIRTKLQPELQIFKNYWRVQLCQSLNVNVCAIHICKLFE